MSAAEGQAQLPNLLLIGAGTAYPYSRIKGLDRPAVRDTDIERIADHGAFSSVDYLPARFITIEMGVDASANPSGLEGLLDTLGEAFNPASGPAQMTYRKRGGVERLIFAKPTQLSDVIDMESVLGLPTVVGELKCPDPLVYSATQTVVSVLAGSGTVTNAGKYRASPVLNVGGPATNPRFTLAGGYIQANVSMGALDSLVIDVAARSVLLNGVSRRDLVTTSAVTWWTVPPGSNNVTYSGGGTSATVTIRDTYTHG